MSICRGNNIIVTRDAFIHTYGERKGKKNKNIYFHKEKKKENL